jgi:hypothetical protein
MNHNSSTRLTFVWKNNRGGLCVVLEGTSLREQIVYVVGLALYFVEPRIHLHCGNGTVAANCVDAKLLLTG